MYYSKLCMNLQCADVRRNLDNGRYEVVQRFRYYSAEDMSLALTQAAEKAGELNEGSSGGRHAWQPTLF